MKNKKISISATIENQILDEIKNKFGNRSKLIQKLIIEEICKDENIEYQLRKMNIIL